ncbi:NIF3-like protein 1 isoform X2 [Leguminivora glycinivorella]|uniref:NIF3-like protein 1 isoform X2 n=1 Tax=Leguminivora glycinivorella TaxID=1035111 RepID=UPI00200F02C4|nr:NIF3-like protein 1 isoform X2 [Leguminivora glycinivorella]
MSRSSILMLVKLGSLHIIGKQTVFPKFYSISASIKMSMGEREITGLTLGKVVSVLEDFAPKSLAESWDNTGLLVEPYTPRNITKLLLTNDLTETVAKEADKQGCEMIVAYHPPIFAPLKSVVQSAWKQRIVSFLLEKRISLYSPHTSWDCVQGGVNDWLASAFTVKESKPITPGADPNFGAGRYLHLQTEIPLSDAIGRVKQLTGLPHVRLALAKGKSTSDGVKTVALCAGSGASVLKEVPADLYLTGEMLHHDVLDAAQKGISVILTNHSDSERGFLSVFSPDLQKRLDNQVKVFVSKTDKDPLVTV